MTQIVIKGDAPQRIKDRIRKIVEKYVNAVDNGNIQFESKPKKITINAGDHPDTNGNDYNGRTIFRLNLIKIDVDKKTNENKSYSYESTTLHELTHLYNQTLHKTGQKNAGKIHHPRFYQKVDADAALLNIDPKHSGTKHPNYKKALAILNKKKQKNGSSFA